MKDILGVFLFAFFLLSCSDSNSNQKQGVVNEEEIEAVASAEEDLIYVEVDPSFLIAPKRVGNFSIGMDIGEVRVAYDVRESEKQIEEGFILTQYLVDNGNIALERDYDYDADEHLPEISNIYVKGGDYMTDRGIKVGSSLGDFVKSYPDFKIAFSYIAYNFWVEEGEDAEIQFYLDLNPDDFKNKAIDLFSTDYIALDYKDFDPDTRIREIKIY